MAECGQGWGGDHKSQKFGVVICGWSLSSSSQIRFAHSRKASSPNRKISMYGSDYWLDLVILFSGFSKVGIISLWIDKKKYQRRVFFVGTMGSSFSNLTANNFNASQSVVPECTRNRRHCTPDGKCSLKRYDNLIYKIWRYRTKILHF